MVTLFKHIYFAPGRFEEQDDFVLGQDDFILEQDDFFLGQDDLMYPRILQNDFIKFQISWYKQLAWQGIASILSPKPCSDDLCPSLLYKSFFLDSHLAACLCVGIDAWLVLAAAGETGSGQVQHRLRLWDSRIAQPSLTRHQAATWSTRWAALEKK